MIPSKDDKIMSYKSEKINITVQKAFKMLFPNRNWSIAALNQLIAKNAAGSAGQCSCSSNQRNCWSAFKINSRVHFNNSLAP
jgi:hypothetical protein